MSVSQFVIIGNWILEGEFKQKWSRLKSEKAIWLFVTIYLVHILGLLTTSWNENSLHYAFNDLRIKLPLLLLPIFIGSSGTINRKELKRILYLFVVSVFVGTIITNVKLLSPLFHTDFRLSSQYISHIRFSLMITLSIFFLLYYSVNEKYTLGIKIIHWCIVIWFLFSMILLRSLTGVVVLYLTSLILYFIYLKKIVVKFRIGLAIVLLIIPAYLFYQVKQVVTDYYHVNRLNASLLPTLTTSGNKYFHDTNRVETENGNRIWVSVCETEMRLEWNKKSRIKYDSLDLRKNDVSATLLRYLTSKGFTKDSVGISKLSDNDIQNVENSISNCIYIEKKGLYPRIYETIWEFDHYIKYGNPSGHSTMQRFEFLKTARKIISENIWLGVGTGNVQDAFNKKYEQMNSPLDIRHRLRAHNQFVTLLVTFGIFGATWIVFVLFYLPYKKKLYHHFLFLSSFIVVMLSWLNEDTLETQAGVTFFLIFIILFLFGMQDEKEESEKIA